MKHKNTEIITARVTKTTKRIIRKFVRRGTHLNESDFIRSAVREKIRNDAPDLFDEMMSEE